MTEPTMPEPAERLSDWGTKKRIAIGSLLGALLILAALSLINGLQDQGATKAPRAAPPNIPPQPRIEDFGSAAEAAARRLEAARRAEAERKHRKALMRQVKGEEPEDDLDRPKKNEKTDPMAQKIRDAEIDLVWKARTAPYHPKAETAPQTREARATPAGNQLDALRRQRESVMTALNERLGIASDQAPEPDRADQGGALVPAIPPGGGLPIPPGTVIQAVTKNAMGSDFPGPVAMVVQQPVYSVDGRYVLIPAGVTLTGRSTSSNNINEAIAPRLGATIKWLSFPDGRSVDLGKASTALNADGLGGIEAERDLHIGAQAWGVLVSLAFSSPGYLLDSGGILSPRQAAMSGLAAGSSQIGQRIGGKYLNVQPTKTVEAGTPVAIFIEAPITLPAYELTDKTIY